VSSSEFFAHGSSVVDENVGVARGVDLEQARYSRMRWNTPLSADHAATLIECLDVASGACVLDLGCGWGELLIRLVSLAATGPGGAVTGVGVDTDALVLQRGRALAAERGVAGQVSFVCAGAQAWKEPADRVLCVGAAHAWGDARQALPALAKLIRPGGRLLFGDGCWEKPPTDAARALFGDSVLSLAEVVAVALAAGWHVLELSCADQREWDEFESTWRAGRQEWLLSYPDDPRAAAVQAELDARLTEYVTVYRGELGFCYLILSTPTSTRRVRDTI
jgi:SAM-dependent methyltransferase